MAALAVTAAGALLFYDKLIISQAAERPQIPNTGSPHKRFVRTIEKHKVMPAALTEKEEITLANQAEVYQSEITYEGGIVLCPICGGDYLHQGAVEVWNREYGADTDGVRITKNGETTSPLADNPSRERRGLVMEFECEDCGEFGSLVVSQDAGHTSIIWNCDKANASPHR